MAAAFAISVNSIDDLFDPYTAEPLASRPLRAEVRERILRAWIDSREERPDHLSVELPVGQRRAGVGEDVRDAIRSDLERAYRASGHLLVFTRSERREALIAFSFLVVCLLASSLVDRVTDDDALFVGVSQGLVVLGWVAMWQPAQQLVQALSLRLSRKRYRELTLIPIEVSWG
ncbi:MAG: hypothetical protein KJ006_11040 [Thermoleophilia bacterium]|nr:hypothetical protein [Thermoleophilia bacterium]GIK76906.1 MAG: hypothetical protein BroJett022_05960 [Actinomycetes bacterium]